MRALHQHARRGGALLELALFTPILIYMLVAVGDFGRYYVESSRLGEVATNAARREARGPSEQQAAAGAEEIQITVATFCSCPEASAERFACGARSCGDYGEPARYVQANVEKPFSFIARYPGFPSKFTMRSQAGVRVR